MDKEADGLVFEDKEIPIPKATRWSVVGKVCSTRPLKMTGLEKTMPRAWGLHKEAKFRDMGSNIFVAHLGSEGDWRHVLNNGPWQYDFSVLILKEYEGNIRPSEMVFENIDIWVRVMDLPPDKRCEAFGTALGNWIGKAVRVDTDGDGIARGQQLRIRTTISVYEPLIRGFNLKKSKEDKEGTWYDFYYEKVPHFCFECGRLVHVGGVCVPPLDSSDQWGSWLRASPGRNNSTKEGSFSNAAESSSNSFVSSQGGEGGKRRQEQVRVRDLPTKRNLGTQFASSVDRRTGGRSRHDAEEVNSLEKDQPGQWDRRGRDLRENLELRREKDLREKLVQQNMQRQKEDQEGSREVSKGKEAASYGQERHAGGRHGYRAGRDEYYCEPGMHGRPGMHGERGRKKGYYVKKLRQEYDKQQYNSPHPRHDSESRMRGPKQYWKRKGENDRLGTDDGFIRDTRRETSTVFDRISEKEDSSADPVNQGRREQ